MLVARPNMFFNSYWFINIKIDNMTIKQRNKFTFFFLGDKLFFGSNL